MDIIGEMPDSIRNHIVSFLSMEDAVRTSVLSKQWRNVCSSLPIFEFWQGCFERMRSKRYDFEDFVDKTICRHDGSSIERFLLHLKAEDLYEDARIISWITFAIDHKVKDLTIHIPKFDSLPDCLFTCVTLTNLLLWNVTLNTPAELKFPKLKRFNLSSVHFNGNNQTNQLVVNCPLLETLTFTYCSRNRKNTVDLIIHALNLKTLSVFPCSDHNVTVHCPHLSKFRYYGHAPDISSESISSLVDASFGCPFSVPITALAKNVVDQRVSNIVMGLSNVVYLSLDQFWIEILSRTECILSNQALSFRCLKTLDVKVFAKENQVHFVAFLLQIYPNLKTLNICFMEQDEHTDMLNMGGYCHQQKLSYNNRILQIRLKKKIFYTLGLSVIFFTHKVRVREFCENFID